MITCEFCNSSFKNDYILNNHKKTTKYCLIIQGKITKKINEVEKEFKCEYCEKILSTKQILQSHYIICDKKKYSEIETLNCEKEKNQIEMKELNEKYIKIKTENENYKEQLLKQEENYKEQLLKQEEKIKELQDKLERLATTAISKPTTTNNTKITFNGILDLSHERISNIVANNLTGDHIVDGMTGIAKFVKDKIITADDGTILYNCADASRQVFKYKNNEGDILKDQKANKLIGAIQPALKEKTNDLYFYYDNEIKNYVPDEEDKKNFFTKKDKFKFLKDESLKIHDDISEMHQNNKFSTELVNLVTK